MLLDGRTAVISPIQVCFLTKNLYLGYTCSCSHVWLCSSPKGLCNSNGILKQNLLLPFKLFHPYVKSKVLLPIHGWTKLTVMLLNLIQAFHHIQNATGQRNRHWSTQCSQIFFRIYWTCMQEPTKSVTKKAHCFFLGKNLAQYFNHTK